MILTLKPNLTNNIKLEEINNELKYNLSKIR